LAAGADGPPAMAQTPCDRRPTADAVLTLLYTHGRLHVLDLAERLDRTPADVEDACFRLQRAGLARARGGGDYSVTARGERRVRRQQ
jgi:Mn-dependent DtxR family transcriptional regulator